MKYTFFAILVILAATACKNEPKTNGNSGNAPKAKTEGWAETAVPAVSSRETALLTKDFWVFEYYVIPGDPEKSMFNRGLWYKLNMNGTFEYGHWEESLGNGTWKLTEFEGTPLLTVDSGTDNSFDMIWELNFGDYSGFEASFVANKYSEQPGVMCKMINIMTRPTKKQFGYE